ncbi:hypothetical protein SAMN05428975_0238 [Mucilaginibacter sp. OK268]|uniref:pirin family protein n=1 Tax=Mucilaginibacter sp. OK268 TaxID=1881048 RepID=UPI000885D3E8|nr:pirin family protein [Mucilaginibacter sp. OK268]SDP07894.1 hypothetical protein SAMN05428975_0238 [Mucilaginibacter sp. OK268]
MKKKISFSAQGRQADVGPMIIHRMLPNTYAQKVGSFVFLDHATPTLQKTRNSGGTGVHPHRGIATLTYIIHGEVEHFDSAGNRKTVHSGGIQWMKAGNGILHDELMNYDSNTDSKLTHGFQFWINLPAKIKAEKPDYLAVEGSEVPQKALPDSSGWIKVILGNYEDLNANIPNYLPQFLYHIHLQPGKTFSIKMENEVEVAALLLSQKVVINDALFQSGEFVEFDRESGTIEISNESNDDIDVLLFGGAPYTEPVVAEGPFVMNTPAEIVDAYRDFYTGKYGKIEAKIGRVQHES